MNLDKVINELVDFDRGIYLDIGAMHSFKQSVTYALYKRGWHGLLVEPREECWPDLLHNRPGDFLSPLAVSDLESTKSLFYLDHEHSTLSPSEVQKRIPDLPTAPIATVPLKVLLKDYPIVNRYCNLMNVDVNGHEAGVMKSFNLREFRPQVVVINSSNYGEYSHIFVSAGYTCHDTVDNKRIYTRPIGDVK